MKPSLDNIRSVFLRFFRERDHAVIASAPLVPDGDASVLFTTAGMHPLVPYLCGQPHPSGRRLVGYQGCLRTNDIDDVGDAVHLTFFEMLGNWSLGDYGKRESIRLSFEFLTSPDYLAIDPDRIWVTVFAGDGRAPPDDEAAQAWCELGLPAERVVWLGEEHNWWAVGREGPCGPDTEIFFDRTLRSCAQGRKCIPGECDCGRFVEIWNNVFMSYERRSGVLRELPHFNIDTGMGLERVAAVLGGHDDVYGVDGLRQVVDEIQSRATVPADEIAQDPARRSAVRILADHLRASVAILGDVRAVEPSNQGAGYVLRRLIRRAIRTCDLLELTSEQWIEVADTVVATLQGAYPELDRDRVRIVDSLTREARRFSEVRARGERLLREAIAEQGGGEGKRLPGHVTFKLHETYGFPLEFTRELAREQGLEVDEDGYWRCFAEHREQSRGQRAKSGLTDSSVHSVRLHTATHLLHAALREVLGPHVEQRGSNITPERLRFDFSHGSPMTEGELEQTRAWVQHIIDEDLPVVRHVTTVDEATAEGALGLFAERYDERVSVYAIGERSVEVCAGPHAARTTELGEFRIIKEQSCSAGVRRIRAVLVPRP